ncbi:MAG: polymer-forming cytoskeletal protein [Actinomycetota bacterium]|nr:polymer-forming cytoskeletal protein [Actinomycetota bacterium]
MNLSASARSPRTITRLLLTLSVAVLGLVALLPLPAHAFEKKAFGDVVVESGEVEEEVSTTFGDVIVDGIVEEDVHSGKGDVVVNGEVGGDINAGMGDVEVNGPVGGEIDAGLGDVYVDAPVRGDVNVGRGDVELGPEALVHGNVHYGSGEVRGSKDAVEGGMIAGRAPHMEQEPDGFGIPGLVGWVFATAAFAACSVLLAVLAPGPLLAAARRAEESPGWSLFFGVVSVPVVVVFAVVLAVSIVGIPLLLLLAPAYLAFVFFGALVAAYFVGRRVVFATGRYRGGNALAAMVGALILSAAYLIPVLGGLLLYGLALFGTGASILALFSRRRTYPSYEAYVRDRRA